MYVNGFSKEYAGAKEVYEKDLDLFLEKKEEFYRVINEFPLYRSENKEGYNRLS